MIPSMLLIGVVLPSAISGLATFIPNGFQMVVNPEVYRSGFDVTDRRFAFVTSEMLSQPTHRMP